MLAVVAFYLITQMVHALFGASFISFAVLVQLDFSAEAPFTKAFEVRFRKDAAMRPVGFIMEPISAISFGMAQIFGATS